MPYVTVPNDLSKIKTKVAFNLTKRHLICFGIGAAIGIPTYLLTRVAIGNTGALFVMLGVMLPAFLMAMYEKDGLLFEKVLRNMIYILFLHPGNPAPLGMRQSLSPQWPDNVFPPPAPRPQGSKSSGAIYENTGGNALAFEPEKPVCYKAF